jgi:TolB-like protein/Tfp pilus assembly protein PilF
MGTEPLERKLAAILYADVAGYSRLTGEDEEGTHRTLSAYLDAITALIERHTGTVMHFAGDAVLAEFASVLNALRCGVNIQRDLMARNEKRPEERKLQFRIGINLGDVIVDRDEIYGDGVNIAARLEGLAEPGGICISDVVRQSVEGKLNLTFEDLGEQSVKNIENPVRAYRVLLGFEVAPKSAPVKTTLADMSSQPSIAVLPFDNMSGDPEQEYFSDGITEDLITDLSKIRELFVVARHATFTYKGKRVMPQQVARELGVGHVLEGSVRKAGTRLRITAQLIDAATGGHLWAERYDRNLTDIFVLQDEITEKIVTALEVKLTEGEQEQVPRRYTENLEAYDYFLRGRAYQVGATNEENARAREMFERAIELDPTFAGAYAQLSYSHFRDWRYQWSKDPQALEWAFEAAQKAVALDGSLPLAHTYLGWAHVWKRQHEQAIAEAERAIALDPNFAEGYARLGEIMNLAGRPEEGVNLLKKAMSLDPHYPPTYLFFLGYGYYAMGQYEEAIAALKRSLARNPDHFSPHRTLAVIFSELGRKEEAQAEVAEMLRTSPSASLKGQRERMPFKDQAVLERYMEGLRKAGLPE